MGKVTRRYVNIMNGNRFKELVEQEKRGAEEGSGIQMNKVIAGFILGAITGAAIYQPAANWARWGIFTLFSRGDK